VFIKVHLRLATVQDETRLTSWLYRVTHNQIVDYYRKQRPTPCGIADTSVADDDTDDDAERTLAPVLRDLIDELPDKYREALTLTEIEGLTQRGLGRRLGLTDSGAKSRVQRGRAMLRDRLLDCCRIELDCRNHVIDYQSRSGEPTPEDCRCAQHGQMS
jgi:RNA polymerase sigma-70 factor (ECF subfamily)